MGRDCNEKRNAEINQLDIMVNEDNRWTLQVLFWILNERANLSSEVRMQQAVQYCETSDGVRLAYSFIGEGPLIVRAPHWFSHLEQDLHSEAMSPALKNLARQNTLLRYDPRGIGLSDREPKDISFDLWVSDLETVINHTKVDKFVLLGFSQGVAQAIAYAHKHPDKVDKLVLFSGYHSGALHRADIEKEKENLDLSKALIRSGWGGDGEAHRQFFTSQFMPDANLSLHKSLNEIQRIAATPEIAARYVDSLADTNVERLLTEISVPTLVFHSKGDLRAPFAQGQEIAAKIPNARFIVLNTNNHILVEDEPSSQVFFDEFYSFIGQPKLGPSTANSSKAKSKFARIAMAAENNILIKLFIAIVTLAGLVLSLKNFF